ncbi:hypothetical protein FACS1894217_00740 [Clostridia bacterium]|nr:hypothetical protein FACS1894217_00740 [Clostridia bacterium]
MDLAKNIERQTVSDFRGLPENTRAELVDGAIVMMAGASAAHQRVQMNLSAFLHGFLRGRSCRVFPAGFDVHLVDRGDEDVFQPDVLVVCDKSKLREDGCYGAPDFIAEILSPSTSRHDRFTKYHKYLRAGVREYWIIDPMDNTVHANILRNGKYDGNIYGEDDVLPVAVLPGCEITLKEIFN